MIGQSSHQRCGNWEQHLVPGVFTAVICGPQNLEHGLNSICDVVLVVWGVTLQGIQILVMTQLSAHASQRPTHLIITIRGTYGDFNDDVELCGS